ncbi:MAG TPA: DNA-3-methyladenine glycosylase 2 family protein [Paracoccaceae bacterium]|nr:DNA-3-methyladenine glycosylase 2 family protein [Paracoccaceae bacterium]
MIETDSDIEEGAAWLAAREPRFSEALALTGPLPLRRREGGFPALLKTICSQQLSVASADAVWNRLDAAGATVPANLVAMDETALRACGLSGQKIRYARALAEADIDYRELADLPEEEAIARLTAIKGIGVWTAEIYLMFSVGRADVLAAGDLALQESARLLFGLPERPKDRALRELAAAWSPWRSVAARILWAYYRVAKQREGITE